MIVRLHCPSSLPLDAAGRGAGTGMSEGGREQSGAMRRYLGAGIVAALRDDDVTEIYVNAGGGAVWLDRRSVGRVRSGAALGRGRSGRSSTRWRMRSGWS